MNGKWTEKRVAELTKLCPTHSAAQIARKFGHGFSRNMIAGKAWRLLLVKKDGWAPVKLSKKTLIKMSKAQSTFRSAA